MCVCVCVCERERERERERINMQTSFMDVSHLIQTVYHTRCLIILEGNLNSKSRNTGTILTLKF